ncbi:MAG: hypothetical protein R2753_15640 [Chitinophagales bacterium]
MKPKIPTFVALAFCLFCLPACKNQPQATIKSEIVIPPEAEKIANFSIELTSPLQPNDIIELGKTYTDTVTFLEFNNEGDEWMFMVEKDNNTIGLIDNKERKTELVKGDKIMINWTMDSIRYAGDDEFIEFTEFLIASQKIASVKLQDKEVKVLWRATQYDEDLEMDVNTIILNEDYIQDISEPEKAALAYVATFIGNECQWDENVKEDRSNLKCKILWALELGYQCSNQHLDFLKAWFRNNETVLETFQSCPTTPDGATIQNTFEEINVATKGNQIIVSFKGSGMNLRASESWTWNEKHIFKFNENELIIIKKEVSPKEFNTISFEEH